MSSVENFITNPPDNVHIIYYKPQGIKQDGLDENDLCIGFLTDYQLKYLKNQAGNDSLIISCDATFGLDIHDNKLVELFVKDELGFGFPVAQFLTTTETIPALKLFFSNLLSLVGEIKAKVFMSDQYSGKFGVLSKS